MMAQSKTKIILIALFFGAFCFGAGVFFGQHLLIGQGFVYEEGASAGEQASPGGEQVNINTAEAAALREVRGIGSVTAEKIVESREEDGRFEEVRDLVTRGIMGETKYGEVEAFLTAE